MGHVFSKPTTLAALPLVQTTLPMVRKEAAPEYDASLHLNEKLAMVEPGQDISKGPTRDDALPDE